MLIGASVLTVGSVVAGFPFAIEPSARYVRRARLSRDFRLGDWLYRVS